MKKRFGFVSNSSSQSFCIYGAYLDSEKNSFLSNYDNWDGFEEKAEGLGLYAYSAGDSLNESNDGYVGVSWSVIRDDETGKQFKERIANLLNELKKKEPELKIERLATHERAWENR